MIIFRNASKLSSKQLSEINNLVLSCIEYEGLTLSVPDLSGEEDQVYLFYEGRKQETLLGILIAYPQEDYTEITAFTHPDCRMQGIFSSLFERFMSKNEETPIVFYPDGNSYDALAAIYTFECEYGNTEELMELDLKAAMLPYYSQEYSLSVCDDIEVLSPIHSRSFDLSEEESQIFLDQSMEDGSVCWLIKKEDQPIGMCMGNSDDKTVYLFGLCIDPQFQHQGMGTNALALILDCLSAAYHTVKIQVTEENTAAFRLYKNAGFKVTQELQEYWF